MSTVSFEPQRSPGAAEYSSVAELVAAEGRPTSSGSRPKRPKTPHPSALVKRQISLPLERARASDDAGPEGQRPVPRKSKALFSRKPRPAALLVPSPSPPSAELRVSSAPLYPTEPYSAFPSPPLSAGPLVYGAEPAGLSTSSSSSTVKALGRERTWKNRLSAHLMSPSSSPGKSRPTHHRRSSPLRRSNSSPVLGVLPATFPSPPASASPRGPERPPAFRAGASLAKWANWRPEPSGLGWPSPRARHPTPIPPPDDSASSSSVMMEGDSTMSRNPSPAAYLFVDGSVPDSASSPGGRTVATFETSSFLTAASSDSHLQLPLPTSRPVSPLITLPGSSPSSPGLPTLSFPPSPSPSRVHEGHLPPLRPPRSPTRAPRLLVAPGPENWLRGETGMVAVSDVGVQTDPVLILDA